MRAAAVAALATASVAVAGVVLVAAAGEERAVTYLVVPHPDDEWQGWSLVARQPEAYTVVVLLTRGEQTGFCTPEGLADSHDPVHEPPPEPWPQGRFTDSCEQARLSSWRGFFTDMSGADPTLPGDLEPLGRRGPFPVGDVEVCRRDDLDDAACSSTDTSAHVWRDRRGRGALVSFDLGDGDLSPAEVRWAMRTVRDNRAALGLDTERPDGRVVGAAYTSSSGHEDCYRYDHRDHEAVTSTLREAPLGMGEQHAAVCRADGAAARTLEVDAASVVAAFGERDAPLGEHGAHGDRYGWLWAPVYPLDRDGQRELFHVRQSFAPGPHDTHESDETHGDDG